jgi:hypothetical protein
MLDGAAAWPLGARAAVWPQLSARHLAQPSGRGMPAPIGMLARYDVPAPKVRNRSHVSRDYIFVRCECRSHFVSSFRVAAKMVIS